MTSNLAYSGRYHDGTLFLSIFVLYKIYDKAHG
jgi:hypothetical protein